MTLRRIDEAEQHEVRQQQLPVRLEAQHHAIPVERLGARAQDVRDVGAVVALALHHERLLPEQLFDRRDLHRHAEDVGFERVREPHVVDAADAVARAEDEVDDVVALLGLGEPVRERDLGVIARPARNASSAGIEVVLLEEEVEVLRFADDARCS